MTFFSKAAAGLFLYLISSAFGTSLATNLPDSKNEYTQHQLPIQQLLDGIHLSDPLSLNHDFVGSPVPQVPVRVS